MEQSRLVRPENSMSRSTFNPKKFSKCCWQRSEDSVHVEDLMESFSTEDLGAGLVDVLSLRLVRVPLHVKAVGATNVGKTLASPLLGNTDVEHEVFSIFAWVLLVWQHHRWSFRPLLPRRAYPSLSCSP